MGGLVFEPLTFVVWLITKNIQLKLFLANKHFKTYDFYEKLNQVVILMENRKNETKKVIETRN